MSVMRWLGVTVAVLAFAYVFYRFRHGRARVSDFCLSTAVSLGLLIISIYPNAVNLLRDMLLLQPRQYSRLIALAILSNLLLWIFLFTTRLRWSDHSEQFDLLVRQLGVSEFRRLYPALEALPPIAVIIPAFNEQDNIATVIESMPKQVGGKDVACVVVDDGSRDDTLSVARSAGAFAVRSPMNRGGGAALRIGFDIARDLGAEIVVTMDADGQHLPAEIEALIRPIIAGEFDFVIGSRILGEHERDSLVRYIGIHVFNLIIRILTPAKITDCSNGFRAFHMDHLSRVLLRQDQFHTSELIIDAAKKGIRIGEAPVTVKRRLSGHSKKGRNLSYGINFARAMFKAWFR